ncbi:MAG: Bax inhibitor-1/YccA family protein [Bifidobacteriaceae bacterium]|jgi:uncharacterized YccA/Bax inhibitor family protein|nr:Bax inhibitor-1/YccA family protein [Bifidobacteriaceae bacterium]
MRNPVFSRSADFKANPSQHYGFGSPSAGYASVASVGAGQLNAMYAQPAAGPLETGRVTYDDILIKSAGMFGLLLVGATVGWLVAPRPGGVGIIFGCAIAGFVLALVNIFKRRVSRLLVIAYSLIEGVFVGGISRIFEAYSPGVVVQAVIASLCVFGATLALFASGKVRASGRMTKIVCVALVGYLIFCLVNLVLMWTGVLGDRPFGLRSVPVFGVPLGVVLGIVVVFMAAYCLVVDFDAIKTAVGNGAPADVAWTCAFGLVVDMVFLYLEVLRLLAIFNRN